MLLQVILNQNLQQTTLCVAEHDLHNEFFVILSLPLKKEIDNSFIQNFIAYDEFNFSYLDDEFFWLENISITKNILAFLHAADLIDLTVQDLNYIDQISLKNKITINDFDNLGFQSPIKTIPRNLSSEPKHLNKFILIGDNSPKLLQSFIYFENNDLIFSVNKRKINSYQFFHHLNSNKDRIRFKQSLINQFVDNDKLIKFISSLDYYSIPEENLLSHEEDNEINIENSENDDEELHVIKNEILVNDEINDEKTLIKDDIHSIETFEFILFSELLIQPSLPEENVLDIDNTPETIDSIIDNTLEINNDSDGVVSPTDTVNLGENQVEINHISENIITKDEQFNNDIKSLEDRFYDFFNDDNQENEFYLEPIKNITDDDIKEQIREFQKNNPVELKNKNDILKNIKKINVENKTEPIKAEILPIDDIVNYINDIVDESSKLEKNHTENIYLFNFIITAKIKNPIDESFLNNWNSSSLDDEINKIDDESINDVKEEVSIFENIVLPNSSEKINNEKIESILNEELSISNDSIDTISEEINILTKISSCFVYYIEFIHNCNIVPLLRKENTDIPIISNFVTSYTINKENNITEQLDNHEIAFEEIKDNVIIPQENIKENLSVIEDSTPINNDLIDDIVCEEKVEVTNNDNQTEINNNKFIQIEVKEEIIEPQFKSIEEYQQQLIDLSMNNDIDGVVLLYKNYPKSFKPLIDFNYFGDNPLCIASFKENIDLVKILIENGWNPNYFDANLNNALIIAAAEGHKHIVKYLLTKKVQINFQNKKGYTALHFAVNDCNHRIVKLLIEAGADVNAQDNDKNTPLSIAAFKGDNNSTKLLLKTHINVHLKNKQGYDARSIAIISKNNAIAKLIEEKIVNDKNNVSLPPIIDKNI